MQLLQNYKVHNAIIKIILIETFSSKERYFKCLTMLFLISYYYYRIRSHQVRLLFQSMLSQIHRNLNLVSEVRRWSTFHFLLVGNVPLTKAILYYYNSHGDRNKYHYNSVKYNNYYV